MSETNQSAKSILDKIEWKSWLTFIVIAVTVYFANVEIQSYLGKKAQNETGLVMLSLDDAMKKAIAENKLVLASVSAIWCPSCRKLDQSVFSDKYVQQAIDNAYVFSRIDYESDEAEAFMEKYNVFGFPTIVILDAEGNFVRKLSVTLDPKTFVSYL